MRVCLIARRFYESNTHMQQFAKALARRGDTVDVIAARRPGFPIYEVYDGINVYRIQPRNIDERGLISYLAKILIFVLRATVSVGICHLKNHYDLIHVQSVPDTLVFSALIPKILGTPVILDLRDLVPELSASKFNIAEDSLVAKALRLAEKLSVAFADHVIVANPIWHERVVSRSAKASKCSMIWYSPDPTLFCRHPSSPSNGRFVMMYPGTLSRHQGVDIAIRAMPKITKLIPQAELHIYAEGRARRTLESLTRELQVGTSVKFFDIVPTALLVERMAKCNLAVVPKRASEQFGDEAASTKIPEFMALGVPVVASRTKIESHFYNDSEICYFRSEDEDDLVRAIVSVHGDPALRERLSSNALEKTRQGAEEACQDYLGLVDSLVEQRVRKQREPATSARTSR